MLRSFPCPSSYHCAARGRAPWRIVPALAAFGGITLLAQTVAPPTASTQRTDPEETIELSPFVVNAESDRGYVATSTLAGGRTKMELRDVAAQVSVCSIRSTSQSPVRAGPARFKARLPVWQSCLPVPPRAR